LGAALFFFVIILSSSNNKMKKVKLQKKYLSKMMVFIFALLQFSAIDSVYRTQRFIAKRSFYMAASDLSEVGDWTSTKT